MGGSASAGVQADRQHKQGGKSHNYLATSAAKTIFSKYDPAGADYRVSNTGFIGPQGTKAGKTGIKTGADDNGLEVGLMGFLEDTGASNGAAKTPPKVNLATGQWLASQATAPKTTNINPIAGKGSVISKNNSKSASLKGRSNTVASSSPGSSKVVSAVAAAKKK